MLHKADKVAIVLDIFKGEREDLHGLTVPKVAMIEKIRTGLTFELSEVLREVFPDISLEAVARRLKKGTHFSLFTAEILFDNTEDLEGYGAVMICGSKLNWMLGFEPERTLERFEERYPTHIASAYKTEFNGVEMTCFCQDSILNIYKYYRASKDGTLKKTGKASVRKRIQWCSRKSVEFIRGTLAKKTDPKIYWVTTPEDVEFMLNWIETTGIAAYDTETRPAQPGLPKEDWLRHSTKFWLAKTRMMLFTPQPGVSFVLPTFDEKAGWQLHKKSKVEVYPIIKNTDGVEILRDEILHPQDYTAIPDTLDDEQLYYVSVNDEIITGYGGEKAEFEPKFARSFLSNQLWIESQAEDTHVWAWVRKQLKDRYFENPDIEKVLQNFSFDHNMTRYPKHGLGMDFYGKCYDAMRMHRVLDKNHDRIGLKPNLERLYDHFIGWGDWFEDDFYTLGSLVDLGNYGAVDSDGTMRVYLYRLAQLVQKPKLYNFWRNGRLGVQHWFSDLEYYGDRVDLQKAEELNQELRQHKSNLEAKILAIPELRKYILNKNEFYRSQALEVHALQFKGKILAEIQKIQKRVENREESGKHQTKKGEETITHKSDKHKIQLLKGWADNFQTYENDPVAFIKDLEANQGELPKNYPPAFFKKEFAHRANIYAGALDSYLVWDDYPSEKSLNDPKKRLGSRFIKKVKGHFNLASNDDVGAFIYDPDFGLKFPLHSVKKAGKVELKAITESNELYWMQDADRSGFIKTFMEWRGIAFYVTKVEEKLREADPNGYLHANYGFTETDRTRSNNPNAQNEPGRTEIENNKPWLKRYKQIFSFGKNYIRAKCDLSQAEIRFFAWVFGITQIIKNLEAGLDLHIHAARICLGISKEEWDKMSKKDKKKFRNYGKIFNFSLLYGGKSLIDYARSNFKVIFTPEQAKKIRHNFLYVLYPEIGEMLDRVLQKTVHEPFAETMFGSRRDLRHLTETGEKWQILRAYRLKLNTPVQGSAGIFQVLSGVLTSMRLKVSGYDARIFNIIHDDIPCVCHWKDAAEVGKIIKSVPGTFPFKELFGFKNDFVELTNDFEAGFDPSDLKYEIEDFERRDCFARGESAIVPSYLVDEIKTGKLYQEYVPIIRYEFEDLGQGKVKVTPHLMPVS